MECLASNHIKFDFLGKDSIRYENEVAVEPRVWQLVKEFCRGDRKAGAGWAVYVVLSGTLTLSSSLAAGRGVLPRRHTKAGAHWALFAYADAPTL